MGAGGSESWYPLSAASFARGGPVSSVSCYGDYPAEVEEADPSLGEEDYEATLGRSAATRKIDDERRILDEDAPVGSTIATQPLSTTPPSRTRFPNKG